MCFDSSLTKPPPPPRRPLFHRCHIYIYPFTLLQLTTVTAPRIAVTLGQVGNASLQAVVNAIARYYHGAAFVHGGVHLHQDGGRHLHLYIEFINGNAREFSAAIWQQIVQEFNIDIDPRIEPFLRPADRKWVDYIDEKAIETFNNDEDYYRMIKAENARRGQPALPTGRVAQPPPGATQRWRLLPARPLTLSSAASFPATVPYTDADGDNDGGPGGDLDKQREEQQAAEAARAKALALAKAKERQQKRLVPDELRLRAPNGTRRAPPVKENVYEQIYQCMLNGETLAQIRHRYPIYYGQHVTQIQKVYHEVALERKQKAEEASRLPYTFLPLLPTDNPAVLGFKRWWNLINQGLNMGRGWNLWLWGDKNTGKTRLLKMLMKHGPYYNFHVNKANWQDGYDENINYRFIMIEEFPTTTKELGMPLSQFNGFLDGVTKVPVKYLDAQVKNKTIPVIVTGNVNPADAFIDEDPAEREALLDRFEIVHTTPKNPMAVFQDLWDPEISVPFNPVIPPGDPYHYALRMFFKKGPHLMELVEGKGMIPAQFTRDPFASLTATPAAPVGPAINVNERLLDFDSDVEGLTPLPIDDADEMGDGDPMDTRGSADDPIEIDPNDDYDIDF